MGKENVEIYTLTPDSSRGHMLFPRNGFKTGEEINSEQARKLLEQAQFRGLYFSGSNGSGYSISSHDGPPDQPADFSKRFLIGRDDPYEVKILDTIAEKVSEVRPGQSVIVVIF